MATIDFVAMPVLNGAHALIANYAKRWARGNTFHFERRVALISVHISD